MVQTIKVSNGDTLNFPDEMTDDQIHAAIQKEYGAPPSQMDQIKQAFSQDGIKQRISSAPLVNLVAGGLNGATSLLQSIPNLSNMVPGSMKSDLPYPQGQRPIDRFNPYKFMGTSNQPITTQAGALQAIGGLALPIKAIPGGKIVDSAKNLGSKILDQAKNSDIVNTAKTLGAKLNDYFNPVPDSKDLLTNIGKGSKNMEQISTSIGDDIRAAHDDRLAQSKIFTDHTIKQVGNDEIYPQVSPLFTTQMDKGKKIIDTIKGLNVGKLFESFKAKPSFTNAHALQSELGVMIGDLENTPQMTGDIRRQISTIKSARDTLKNDMFSFLDKKEPEVGHNISGMYKRGSDLYRDNVVPFLSSGKLRDIVRGGQKTVKDIHDIFDTPSDLVDKTTGATKIGHVNKILQDLPEETRGKILFSKTGAMSNSGKPQALVDSYRKAENDGFSTYFDDKIRNSLSNIQTKINRKSHAETAAKYIGIPAIGGLIADELLRRHS